MKKIIGVRFKKPGKIYFFDPGNLEINKNDNVIVETTMGEEIGIVIVPKREIQEEKMATPLKKVIRVANKNDLDSLEKYKNEKERMYQAATLVLNAERKIEVPDNVWSTSKKEYFVDNIFKVLTNEMEKQELVENIKKE